MVVILYKHIHQLPCTSKPPARRARSHALDPQANPPGRLGITASLQHNRVLMRHGLPAASRAGVI